MRFRLIKSGMLTSMMFTLFRGVFSDKIYVLCGSVSENSIGVPPLRILCDL